MTRAAHRRAGLVLAGALILSASPGCTTVGGQVSLEEALEDRAEVRALTQDLAAAAESVGLAPSHAYGSWTTCTDRGSTWQYSTDAVLRSEDASAERLQAVLDVLVEEVGLVTAGPGAFGQATQAQGTAGHLDVRVRSYDDAPELVISVYGPCAAVPDQLRDDELGGVADQALDIGGSRPSQQGAAP